MPQGRAIIEAVSEGDLAEALAAEPLTLASEPAELHLLLPGQPAPVPTLDLAKVKPLKSSRLASRSIGARTAFTLATVGVGARTAVNEMGQPLSLRGHSYGLEVSLELTGPWAGPATGGGRLSARRQNVSVDQSAALAARKAGAEHAATELRMPRWRRSAAWLVDVHALETVVMLTILANTVVLAAYHPGGRYDEAVVERMGLVELAITTVYTLEMVVRIAATGFWSAVAGPARTSYLYDGWNLLDFFVVLTSWASIAVERLGTDVPLEFSALRALRILRVIKSLRWFADIQAIISTLFKSVGASASILCVLGFIFIVGGVVGVQMFGGMLRFRCAESAPQPDGTGWDWEPGMGLGNQHTPCWPGPTAVNNCSLTECPGVVSSPFDTETGPVLAASRNSCPPCYQVATCPAGQMCWEFGNPGFGNHGFDNIVQAWATLFIMMTQLYWWETAYYVEMADAGISSAIAWPLIFLIVVVLSFFAVNMFVAVVTATFAATREERANRTFNQRDFVLVHVKHATRPPPVADADLLVTFTGNETVGELLERLDTMHGIAKERSRLFWGLLDEIGADGVEKKLSPGRDLRGFTSKEMELAESLAWYVKQEKQLNEARHQREQTLRAQRKLWKEVWHVQVRDGREVRSETRMLTLNHPPPFYRVRFFHRMIVSPTFELIILMAIVGNTIALLFEHPFMSDDLTSTMRLVETGFSLLFTAEAVAKVLGMGALNYISSPLNMLDFAIVCVGLASMISEVLPGSSAARLVRLFRVAKVARVGRVARLFSIITQMRELILTVFGSGATIGNIIITTLFVITVNALLGIHMFGGKFPAAHPVPRRSFESFPRAWLLHFQILTGDDWSNQMYAYMNVTNGVGTFLYFSLSFILTNYMLMNLFVAVILENFELDQARRVEEQAVHRREIWRQMLDYFISGGVQQQVNPSRMAGGENLDAQTLKRAREKTHNCGQLGDSNFGNFKVESEQFNSLDQLGSMSNQQTWTLVSPLRWLIIKLCRCCGRPQGLCSVAETNDSALCLFHGRIRENVKMINGTQVEVLEYSHFLRRVCERLEHYKWFERAVILTIITSSVLLAWEGPPGSRDGEMAFGSVTAKQLSDGANLVFFVIFGLELVIKVVANGFLFSPNAYLMDNWNRLDFSVIIFSTLDYFDISSGSWGRILRMARCLRPLRLINKNDGMKRIVSAVLESMSTNIGILFLAATTFCIAAILGVQLFGGKFFYCSCGWAVGPDAWPVTATFTSRDGEEVVGMNDSALCLSSSVLTATNGTELRRSSILAVNTVPRCSPNCSTSLQSELDVMTLSTCQWMNKPYNFDDSVAALESLFTAATLAGWTDVMEASLDATYIDQHPQTLANPFAAVYWITFVFVCSFFFTNLFIGVLVDFINRSDGTAFMTVDQLEWSDLQVACGKIQPVVTDARKQTHSTLTARRIALRIVIDSSWEKLSSFAIICNTISMSAEYYGQSEWYTLLQDQINAGFLIFFTSEVCLKLLGLGPQMFWDDAWNRFDVVVIVSSWVASIANVNGVQAARALRAFRIALILKGSVGKAVRSLASTMVMSIQPSINICALLLLHFSIFAILGMQLFPPPGQNRADQWATNLTRLDEFGQMQQMSLSNFHSFGSAMRLLFECMAGKDWKIVMYEVQDQSSAAFWYFFAHYLLAVFILTNLFVAVIVDGYNKAQREVDLDITRDNMEVFQRVWEATMIAHNYGTTHFIQRRDVKKFLRDVGQFKGATSPVVASDRRYMAMAAHHSSMVVARNFPASEATLQQMKCFHEQLPQSKHSLKQIVSVYDVMNRPPVAASHNQPAVEGLNLDTETLIKFDSGALCPKFDGDKSILRDGKGVLRITIVGAEDLPAMDIGGQSDAFCKISVEERLETTSVCRETCSPVWNETFNMPVRKISSQVRISVFDDDTFKADDEIGYITFVPMDLSVGQTHTLTLDLIPPQFGGATKGSLQLRLIIYPTGKKSRKERTWDEWYAEVMETLPDREKKHPVQHRRGLVGFAKAIVSRFPSAGAVFVQRHRAPLSQDQDCAENEEIESQDDWVHFTAVLETCVLVEMGAATALTEAERQEQMFAEAKRQWDATNAAIRARRLQRILKAAKQGLHRLQVGHPERVALRTLSFPSGRKMQVCKLDNLSDATSEMDRFSAPWT